MFAWLAANLINIALCLALAAVVFLIVRAMVRDRRAGRSPCGGKCADCAMCGGCHAGAAAPKGTSNSQLS